MTKIRLCRSDEHPMILEIVNAAADAYRGIIPDDCWHEPYMARGELEAELAAGVSFWGYEIDDVLVGVMGIQPVQDVDLIRHAYVRPASQRRGIGAGLLGHLRKMSRRRMLVGTWAAATWAIRFYQQHGFELVPCEQKTLLLEAYWTVPKRQIEASVVLANPPLEVPTGEDPTLRGVSTLAGCGKTRQFSKMLPFRRRPVDARHKAGHDDFFCTQFLLHSVVCVMAGACPGHPRADSNSSGCSVQRFFPHPARSIGKCLVHASA